MENLNGMVVHRDVLNREKNLGGSEQILIEVGFNILTEINTKTLKSEDAS
jgi:hypothetical protein